MPVRQSNYGKERGGGLSTEELLMAAQAHDHEAFHQLVSANKQKLYSIAIAYLKDENDALEAIQETTCRAYTKLAKLKEPKIFSDLVNTYSYPMLY